MILKREESDSTITNSKHPLARLSMVPSAQNNPRSTLKAICFSDMLDIPVYQFTTQTNQQIVERLLFSPTEFEPRCYKRVIGATDHYTIGHYARACSKNSFISKNNNQINRSINHQANKTSQPLSQSNNQSVNRSNNLSVCGTYLLSLPSPLTHLSFIPTVYI